MRFTESGYKTPADPTQMKFRYCLTFKFDSAVGHIVEYYEDLQSAVNQLSLKVGGIMDNHKGCGLKVDFHDRGREEFLVVYCTNCTKIPNVIIGITDRGKRPLPPQKKVKEDT
jgi:hypothetical protein